MARIVVASPILMERGCTSVNNGLGFRKDTTDESNFVGSAQLATFTVTGAAGAIAGAVYVPVVLTVPNAALPPSMSLTYHFVRRSVVPEIRALNASDS